MIQRLIDLVLSKIFTIGNYSSQLEEFIVSNDPKNSADVERLSREYAEKCLKGFLK